MAGIAERLSKAESHVVRPAFVFGLAILACAVPASARTWELPANASQSSWAVADLDGDKLADLAASAPGKREGSSYTHRVDIALTGVKATSFVVRGTAPVIRLSFRDIDGDHDRDLIVLDFWSAKAVGVWLNDGTGHFTEANPDDYAGALRQSGLQSCAVSHRAEDSPAGLHEERTPSGSISYSFAIASVSPVVVPAPSLLAPAADGYAGGPRGPPVFTQS